MTRTTTLHATDIFAEVYDELQHKTTMIAQQAFDLLDTESVSGIIVDYSTFWLEEPQNPTGHENETARKWLINYIKEYKGYTYLYE